MNHTTKQLVYFCEGDIEFEEEVSLEIKYSKGENFIINSASTEPNDPPEAELTSVEPVESGVVWSKSYRKAVEKMFSDESKLIGIVEEEMG